MSSVTFNEKSKEGYYLNFNRDEIFKNLIASEGHFRNFINLKEDAAGYLNCIVKHLADAEGHCDEAISHSLIAETKDKSQRFLELRDEIRGFRRWVQSSPITRDEGIREIRKIRRRFEGFNPDYDVSKCETCGDSEEMMAEVTKIISNLKNNGQVVAAHNADDFLLMERELAETVLAKLSKKYGVDPPELVISDKCHEPMIGIYNADKIMMCQTGINLHVLLHEFWHHVQKVNGRHLNESEAEAFSVDYFASPPQKGLYALHTNNFSDRKMAVLVGKADWNDVGTIYGGQILGYSTEYALKYIDTIAPAGFIGKPISFWGNLLGAAGGIYGAMNLKKPYNVIAALVGGYLTTDLLNQLIGMFAPATRLAVAPRVYVAPGAATAPPVVVNHAVSGTGRYVVGPAPTLGTYVVTH